MKGSSQLERLSHPSGMAFILLLYGDIVSHFTGLSVATLVMRFSICGCADGEIVARLAGVALFLAFI